MNPQSIKIDTFKNLSSTVMNVRTQLVQYDICLDFIYTSENFPRNGKFSKENKEKSWNVLNFFPFSDWNMNLIGADWLIKFSFFESDFNGFAGGLF